MVPKWSLSYYSNAITYKAKKRICPAVFLAGPVSDNVYQLPKSTDRLDLGTKLALNDPLLGQEIPI